MKLIFASGFSDSIELLKEYGPVAGVLLLAIAFFLWRDWKREQTLTTQIEGLQKEVREVIIPLVQNCTDTVARNSEIVAHNIKVMERLERRLDES